MKLKIVGDTRKLVSTLTAATLLAVIPIAAKAQNDFPYRTVKIIVPIPPGSTADALPRIVADKLSAKWRQPVVIENRPGAALNIGAEAVAKAEPDGYTLLASPAPPLAINQSLYPRLGFDPMAFVPVTILAMSPNVLVVNPKIPVASLAELISFGKANPGKLDVCVFRKRQHAALDDGVVEYFDRHPDDPCALQRSRACAHRPSRGHVDLMFDNLGSSGTNRKRQTKRPRRRQRTASGKAARHTDPNRDLSRVPIGGLVRHRRAAKNAT